ncbi:MAG: type II toxin-antitoxin system RatA family toxin [Betaproteobacteria bacterium]|nr:type II toxin-antitoxin system RatA family toxin [Betaproteobacteria bacterium]
MSARIERRYSLYTAEQLFDLVADVEKYPEFMPWIHSSRILRREPTAVWVDMVLGIGPLQLEFGSRAELHRPHSIEITSNDAPFDLFRQRWEFATDDHGHAVVGYSYEFSLRSGALELISHAVLDEVVGATIDAFEERARQIFGDKTATGPAGSSGSLAP